MSGEAEADAPTGAEEAPMADVGTEAESAAAPEASPRRRSRLGLLFRLAFAGLVGFALTAAAFLSQTASGQRMVLDEILGRVRGALAGELTVGGVHSQTLLAGVTLTDVRLDAAGGRRVLEADSLVLRYSLFSLLVASPQVRSATLHGLDLEISRGPDDDALNVQRILADGGAGPDTLAPGRPSTIDLGRISVRGGTIVVLTPAEEATRLTVAAPDGTPLRRLAFEGVDMDLEETVLRPGGTVALDARLASFSASVHIVEQPLVVQAAVGGLTFGAEGLRIEGGTFRMPGSLFEGDLAFGPERPGEAWTFAAELRADEWGDLADLRWIDPRIPAGAFRGEVKLRSEEGLDVALRSFEVQSGASTVVATGGARFDERMVLSDMVVTASPLDVAMLAPWMARDVPWDGFLSGQATFSTSDGKLHGDGRMTLVPAGLGGAPTTADFSGTVLTGGNPGAEGVRLRLDPLNYRVLEAFWPGAAGLADGSADLQIDGRADAGILVVADVTHRADTTSTSRMVGRGVFRRSEFGWTTDAQGDLAPLSLELVTRLWPQLELRGSVSGPVRLNGTLDDLQFDGDLAAGGGRLGMNGSIDLATLGASYALEADAEAVSLASFTDRAPEPSIVSGHVALRGSGLALDSLDGTAGVSIRPSRVGPLRITSAAAAVRFAGGLLMVDTMEVDISGGRIGGSGALGMTPAANGEARFAFAIDSLLSLRPMFMGDSLLVRDGLSPLEEELLRVRGIEPDTLPSELDVRMAGSLRGSGAVRGNFGDLGVELVFDARDVAYRDNAVDSAHVEMAASGLPEMRGDWQAGIRALGISWESRRFEEVDFDGTMSQRRGEGTLNIRRRLGERYFATGAFALDSVGGEVALAEASVQIDDLSWVLDGPSRIAWDTVSVRVDSLELRRLGEDPASVTAQGTLTRGGESNFRLDMQGFHVEDATRILQREDIVLSGHVDLSLTVRGPAESPSLDALFQVRDPRYGSFQLSRLGGSLQYRDRSSEFRVDAWDASRNVLSAFGTLPLDLALTDVEERSLDEPMDVRVTADSLDAAIALAYFRTLEDVTGTVSADLSIRGTSREPQPRGTIRLVDGAWTIAALGVRHTGILGDLELRPDRTVGVAFGTSGDGTSTVSGVVTMVPFADPTLDLRVTLDQFQAVSRRDIESMLSGSFTVRGQYRLPVAEGELRVDQGTLFVDEFARSVAVVDLRDPTLFAGGFAVDTTVFVTQPILASLRNPFLDNLRVDIDLSVPRDLWLRSNEMNVEMGGELLVRYDRAASDLVMVGDLQALRGSYQVLGRTFEVDGGTVSFLGQPGVNPSLGIEAVSRVRRRGGDRLEVRTTVTGTLVQPLVTLSTTEAGLSQSDLVSYLLFGVGGGDFGAGGAGAGGDLQGGVSTYLSGALASQVGTALAQGIGFDYLAISQGQSLGGQGLANDFLSNVTTDFLSNLTTAQVEVGRYFGDDVFVVFVLGNPTQAGSSTPVVNVFSGVRVELALSEEWFVEGFWEDRFLRGSGALGQTGLDGQKVVGILTFWDWGYGSPE
ncbi:MAG: translocation/assembly module TamB [Gemmatimonadetes bacterium]|nr:translocation/assembly module TamB [Gemmatimonadota bacterium]